MRQPGSLLAEILDLMKLISDIYTEYAGIYLPQNVNITPHFSLFSYLVYM